ncbi:MAG: SRPBCC domain-containing protein [Ferruginibacter sp.]
MEQNYTWSRFTLRVNVNAPVETLYRLWATRAGMEKWFLRVCEYKGHNGTLKEENEPVQPGDIYRWLWHGWPDGTVENGKILECNGKDFLKFSFGKAGNCSIRIKQEGAYTLVELMQDEIPDHDQGKQYWHVGCKTGWTFYMANLKSICEGGIDLRNKDENLKNVLNS